VGKSHIASRAAAWWLDIHPPGEAFVVTTATSWSQVRAVLWRYIGQAHRKGHLVGRVNQTEWWIRDEMVGMGRKPADYDDGTAFQGIHAPKVLLIIDEAGGVPEILWNAGRTLTSNDGCRTLAIGNPTDPTSHFAKVCAPGSSWNVITIAAADSPNFTGETVPLKLSQSLISPRYLERLTADGCGPGTPIWSVSVEGEFPEDAADGVIMASSLAKCRVADQEHEGQDLLPVELGVDVGQSDSGDMTVIRERRGVMAGRVWRIQSGDSLAVAKFVLKAIIESDCETVKVDANGVGHHLVGHLRDMAQRDLHGAQIVAVYVGQPSTRPKMFPNLRNQIWWEVGRIHSERGTWDLSAIDDRTAADLLAPKWSINSRGQVEVEKKAETKKRLGRSPDDADALLLAFYAASLPAVLFDETTPEAALDGTELKVLNGPFAMSATDRRPFI